MANIEQEPEDVEHLQTEALRFLAEGVPAALGCLTVTGSDGEDYPVLAVYVNLAVPPLLRYESSSRAAELLRGLADTMEAAVTVPDPRQFQEGEPT